MSTWDGARMGIFLFFCLLEFFNRGSQGGCTRQGVGGFGALLKGTSESSDIICFYLSVLVTQDRNLTPEPRCSYRRQLHFVTALSQIPNLGGGQVGHAQFL